MLVIRRAKCCSKNFLVSILNRNEPPENLKVVADLKVRENQPIGTFVGRFSAFDQDDDNLSFALVPGLGDSKCEFYSFGKWRITNRPGI